MDTLQRAGWGGIPRAAARHTLSAAPMPHSAAGAAGARPPGSSGTRAGRSAGPGAAARLAERGLARQRARQRRQRAAAQQHAQAQPAARALRAGHDAQLQLGRAGQVRAAARVDVHALDLHQPQRPGHLAPAAPGLCLAPRDLVRGPAAESRLEVLDSGRRRAQARCSAAARTPLARAHRTPRAALRDTGAARHEATWSAAWRERVRLIYAGYTLAIWHSCESSAPFQVRCDAGTASRVQPMAQRAARAGRTLPGRGSAPRSSGEYSRPWSAPGGTAAARTGRAARKTSLQRALMACACARVQWRRVRGR